ncbi:MAG: mechanosensitive ion channel domain-containing protein [Ilumatobacteraceae bacterium]|nr:MAG: mechanosensitive ion channel [Actinomycetota bacterium]
MRLQPMTAAPPGGDEALSAAQAMSRPLLVFLVVLGGFVLTRLTRVGLRRVMRHVADRSLVAPTRWWRVRVRRDGGEPADVVEQRRRQRVDAASRMLNHLFSLVVWVVVSIAVFHVLDLDAAFFISSAGFLGAGLAIGGQHKVNDYLTGLSVLLEDRYGVGDEIEVELGWREPVRGVVEHIGAVTTRLRDARSTVHMPNATLANVRNLSQEPAQARLEVKLPGEAESNLRAGAAADAMRDVAGTKHLTGVVFVDDIEAMAMQAGQDGGRVELNVRTARPLSDDERQLLVRRTEDLLAARDA